MKNPTAEISQNDSHYTLHGDYYLPDLGLPEKVSDPIGRYGRMRKSYLEKHRPGLYERLLLSGNLYEHLLETDRTCRERMSRIISQMAEAEGVDEQLKASNQLEWITRMNSIRQRAEEIVLAELVFG